jgi:hypothetical protein
MCIAACMMALAAPASLAQEDVEPDVSVNYAYSAVLGAGYYTTPTERILVGRLSLSWALSPINERNRLRLLFPITGGVADIVGEDGDLDISTQLLTATFLPGIAWEHFATRNWMLVPAIQAGLAQDFEADTTAWLYSSSLRSYAWWDSGKHRLGLGQRLLGAGQYIDATADQTGFVLLENGLEWDYIVPWSWGGNAMSASIYTVWQHYFDAVRLDAFSGEEIGLVDMYKLGMAFGFRESITILRFISIHRVGISIGRGNALNGSNIKSITLNLGFPLSYQR